MKLEQKSKRISEILEENKNLIHNILSFDLNNEPLIKLDLSKKNKDLNNLNLDVYIRKTMQKNDVKLAIGKYNEDRAIYKSNLFKNPKEERSIHLGIDLWIKADTPIFAPLAGIIHSFKDNNNFGDYGPTIILEHKLNNTKFYTLYGHLSRESLGSLAVGKKFKAGAKIATVGNISVNGNWPPHLHFQIILDMLGKFGDFPGVASLNERNYFTALCPDPNILLRLT